MIPLIVFTELYRIVTNPTADDVWRIGLIFCLLTFVVIMALISDKIDEFNDKKRMKSTIFKPFSVQENLDNEFMFTIGDHK